MLKMQTLFIRIYFWSHLIQIKREMYCFRAGLAFITCSTVALFYSNIYKSIYSKFAETAIWMLAIAIQACLWQQDTHLMPIEDGGKVPICFANSERFNWGYNMLSRAEYLA